MAVRSCHLPVQEVAGKSVLTIEGLSQGRKLHPLQRAFVRHGAIQCGFCSPGMVMNAYGLLLKKGHPSRAEIMEAMEGNLCRCGCYSRILDAIEEVAADKAATEKRGEKWQ
jgi:carbon-monoxide dehydrogenase small subunit